MDFQVQLRIDALREGSSSLVFVDTGETETTNSVIYGDRYPSPTRIPGTSSIFKLEEKILRGRPAMR